MTRLQVRAAALAAALIAPVLALGQGPDEPPAGRVIAIGSDGRVDIDLGDSRLKGGDVGVVERDGAQVGLASVLWVDPGVTRLRVVSTVPGQEVKVGDTVRFPPRAGPGAGAAEEEFVPLLAPVAAKKTALASAATVFHGRLSASEVYQTLAPGAAWYASSRLDSDGSVERVGGGRWSLDWSGNAGRRDGSVFSTADDYRRVQPHLYRGALTRAGDAGGVLRLGRFYPAELSGLGYVDGAQADAPAGAGLRLGAAAGARPDRTNMGFASRESVAAAYATVERGEPRKLYYTGTAGAMRTFYRGKGDELAALWDQRADLGPKVSLFGALQADFDAGGVTRRSAARVTRLNASGNVAATERVTLRAGANHFEPLDTAADRALAGGTTFYLNNGFWRYWAGSGQVLSAGWRVDEDYSLLNTSGRWTPGQWRLSAGHQGLPGLPAASANVSVYNLYNPAGPDYGGTASASLPFLNDRLAFDASAGARLGPTSVSRRKWWVSDASLHANWRPGRAWRLNAGLTRSWQEGIHSTVVNAGVSWLW